MEYDEGQQAWFDGKSIYDCPYILTSTKYQRWCRGYKDAEWNYNYKTGGGISDDY